MPELLDDPPMPVAEHLIELRKRLISSLFILAGGTILMYQFSGAILSWLARFVGTLVFTAPTEAFQTRIKISIYGGFIVTLPFLLHQVWLFVARTIELRWRKMLLVMLPLSYLLFLLGSALCIFVAVPAAMKFLLSFGSEEIRPLLTLSAYLGFVTTLSLAFGAAFQMPLVLYGLNRIGMVQRAALTQSRRYVIFLCFILSALLTPDAFSQALLAGISVLLFELSLLAMERKPEEPKARRP